MVTPLTLSTQLAPTIQKHRALLIENVQFIYELALAKLELEAFSVEYDVTNGLREFILRRVENMEELQKRVAYFKEIDGKTTDYYQLIKYNRTRSVNQYLTHWIYPYKGKFHPQMIRALINILKLKKGDVVIDPFIGSGTAALEAQLLGIDCLGFDISPLCVLQSQVKTQSVYSLDSIKSLQQKAIDAFLSSNTITLFTLPQKTSTYAEFLESIADSTVHNFYTMGRLVAISDQARRRRNINESFIRNLQTMVQSVEDFRCAWEALALNLGKIRIEQADARHLPLADESVDGVITSPPYSIALDYIANDAHAFKALGYDLEGLRDNFIGVRGKDDARIKLYNQDLLKSLNEIHRVLKPGKYCAIVIGNATYGGQVVKTIEYTIEHCERLGFKLLHNINKILFGLYNVMQTDNTLIFQKKG